MLGHCLSIVIIMVVLVKQHIFGGTCSKKKTKQTEPLPLSHWAANNCESFQRQQMLRSRQGTNPEELWCVSIFFYFRQQRQLFAPQRERGFNWMSYIFTFFRLLLLQTYLVITQYTFCIQVIINSCLLHAILLDNIWFC